MRLGRRQFGPCLSAGRRQHLVCLSEPTRHCAAQLGFWSSLDAALYSDCDQRLPAGPKTAPSAYRGRNRTLGPATRVKCNLDPGLQWRTKPPGRALLHYRPLVHYPRLHLPLMEGGPLGEFSHDAVFFMGQFRNRIELRLLANEHVTFGGPIGILKYPRSGKDSR